MSTMLMMMAVLAGAPAADAGCAAIAKQLSAPACEVVPNGIVLAREPAEANRLAALARQGEQRFSAHFGMAPPRYAIAQGFERPALDALKAAGFRQTLPFPTAEQFEAGAIASVTRAAETQAKAAGLDAATIASVTASATAQWREKNSVAVRHAREAGAVPHELGHLWLIEQYFPTTAGDRPSHYGGAGPDWLDETAGILMEDEVMANQRRASFRKIVGGDAEASASLGVTRDKILDLAGFLKADHPMKSVQEILRAQGVVPTGGVNVLTGDEARAASRGAIVFYLQSRMFADYLIARTRNPAVFQSFAASLSKGQTMDQWLAQDGRRMGLKPSVQLLSDDFRQWATATPAVA
ncbi:hypothetical protein [Sphingomonas sp. LY160]|uniref:hypothetical protein n=1 Tax=Sphingomonas sp. LY160 TaxID=3095342 RepID=UPI002ADEC219|nr:hypothetical protein [Sphingomonas sp. LY160]MEA1071785.1 hypothetical protein [Sphingomonas sp. LY160]